MAVQHITFRSQYLGGYKQIVVLSFISLIIAILTVAINVKVFLLLSALVVIFFMMRSPQTALLITAASTATGFMFYLTGTSTIFPISIPKVCGLITLLSLIVHNLYFRRTFYFGSRVIIPLSFVVLSGLSLVYSTVYPSSTRTVLQLCGSFAFYFLAVNIIKDEKSFKQVILVLTGVYTLLGIYSIIQYLMPSEWIDEYAMQTGLIYEALVDRGIKRSAGLSHPGVISFVFNLLIPYIIYLCYEARSKRQRTLFFVSSLICITAVLLTHTRAAFFSLILIFLVLTAKKVIKVNVPTAVGVVVAVVISGVLLMPSSFFSRVLTFSKYLQEGSVKIRLENQMNALELFLENPVAGTGLGSFEELNPAARPVNKEVTNMLLEIASEMGIIGLASMLTVIVFLLKDSLYIERFYRSVPGCNLGTIMLTSILVSLFSSCFMSNQDFREWWLFISFPVIIRNILIAKQGEHRIMKGDGTIN